MMSDGSPPAPYDPAAAQRASRMATMASVATAAVLIALKAFGWGASGSVSLLASLVDSGLDLIASLGAFFAVRWAQQPADAEHRYGHGKAEAFAGLVQAGLVFASAIFVGWESIDRILSPRAIANGPWAIGVMITSLVLTAALISFQTQALKSSGSLAVKGDRAHYSADLLSNLVSLIGVGSAALMGAAPLDAVAGLLVAVWLFWGALGVLREAADHLLDHALPRADQAKIVALVLEDPQVKGVHRLRTRASGEAWMVQIHADLSPRLTLARAHAILDAAEGRIRAAYPQADVIIHPDPSGADGRSE